MKTINVGKVIKKITKVKLKSLRERKSTTMNGKELNKEISYN